MALSLGAIVQQIRNRCDLTSSEFITDNEITDYINYSLGELYGLLVNSFGGTYFGTYTNRSVSAGSTTLADVLPDDLYKVLGVDLYVGGLSAPQNRITLQPYNWNERNRANALNLYGYATQYATNYRYYIFNDTIKIQPPAASPLDLLIWYVPNAPQFYPGTVVGTLPDYSVYASGILELNAGSIPFAIGDTVQPYIDGFPQGTTYYVIATNPINTTITVSLTPGGPAANLTGWVTYTKLYNPAFDASQTFVNNANLDNWLEYVIVDVSIKCKTKEETDTSMFVRQKSLLTERIRNEAQNRDVSSPAVVTDVYAAGTVTDTGWGWTNVSTGWTP